uniref:Uncharacterized protein n=1 Tax=Arundo donax TaxID=35708 RepID=A0A0A9F1H1_ARUDO
MGAMHACATRPYGPGRLARSLDRWGVDLHACSRDMMLHACSRYICPLRLAAPGPFNSHGKLLTMTGTRLFSANVKLHLHGNGRVGLHHHHLLPGPVAVDAAGRVCYLCCGSGSAADRLRVDDHRVLVCRRRRHGRVGSQLVDGVHFGAAAGPTLVRSRCRRRRRRCDGGLAAGRLLDVLRQLDLLDHDHRRLGLLVPVRHVERHLRDAEDESQHVGHRHEHVLLQRAVREPDHRAQHQAEGQREGHELHALGPDHQTHDA